MQDRGLGKGRGDRAESPGAPQGPECRQVGAGLGFCPPCTRSTCHCPWWPSKLSPHGGDVPGNKIASPSVPLSTADRRQLRPALATAGRRAAAWSWGRGESGGAHARSGSTEEPRGPVTAGGPLSLATREEPCAQSTEGKADRVWRRARTSRLRPCHAEPVTMGEMTRFWGFFFNLFILNAK